MANRYLLVRELGAGATGSVWLAHDRLLDAHCALKLVHAATTEDLRVSFLREAMAAARIRCANVVTIFDYGEWQGLPYIAMENLEGETLDARLLRCRTLSVARAYELVVHVARGLVRAHSIGIVHRDLKPANIFIARADAGEVCKVLDFGIAKQELCAVAAFPANYGEGVGTPYYVSPEQARSGTLDHRADLWSFAAIVCECLTGEPPFVADSTRELLRRAATAPIPSLCERDPALPPALAAWWQRALARDPAERFQSAKDFADGFADACGLARQPVPSLLPRAQTGSLPEIDQAASITVTTVRPRPTARRSLLTALALGALVALGVWWSRSGQPSPASVAIASGGSTHAAPAAPPSASPLAAPPAPTLATSASSKRSLLTTPPPQGKPRRDQHWRYDPGF